MDIDTEITLRKVHGSLCPPCGHCLRMLIERAKSEHVHCVSVHVGMYMYLHILYISLYACFIIMRAMTSVFM